MPDQTGPSGLAEELQIRARQQGAVAELGQQALGGAGLDALMNQAVALAAEILRVEYARVMELLPDGGLRLRAGVGWREGAVGQARVAASGNTLAGAALAAGAPIIVADWGTETHFEPPGLIREHGIVSSVCVVMGAQAGGRAHGVLTADSSRQRNFSTDDVHFLQSVANVLALSIEQQRAEAEQRRLLRQAEAAESKFRLLLESAPDAIVTVDSSGAIVLVNSQTERLFGYSREELLGQPVEMLLPERFRLGHAAQRDGYFAAAHIRMMGIGLELHGRRKNGTQFPVEISLSPLESDEGLLVTSVIRDITDRKRSEEQLRQTADDLARSNAELQQFAYVASHDLQEPLRMVASFTQLLARRYKGKLGPDADEFIGFAVDGATRMQELIGDLLAYSRVGTRGGDFKPADAGAVCDRATGNLRTAIDESGASVTRDELPAVMADASQLGQLFQNLIGNAIKFRGSAPPHVHIRAERTDDAWRFAVSDNGIGIDQEYADRIFVIFQRLHNRAEYPGTGIGLAICKKIVERHGGRIWVESRPGAGSTFFFTIPLSREE